MAVTSGLSFWFADSKSSESAPGQSVIRADECYFAEFSRSAPLVIKFHRRKLSTTAMTILSATNCTFFACRSALRRIGELSIGQQ